MTLKIDWLAKYPGDGELLAVFRRTRECDFLWEHSHSEGAHARPNGSRRKDGPSPICGSCIMLSDMEEVVLISQKGMTGPLEVRIYLRKDKKPPKGLRFLSASVKDIIKKYGFPAAVPEE